MTSKTIPGIPEAAARMPSVYANRINIMIGDDGLGRLTFGTSINGGETQWHAAISVTNANIESLYASLGEILQKAAKVSAGTKPS